MSTQAQIDANRRNARLSTGPRTEEGKAAVSLNALQHGLRSSQVLLPGEDPAEFEALQAELAAEWQPASTSELDLVERMAIAKWRAARCEQVQARLEMGDIGRNPAYVDRIQQYADRLDRSYDRAMNQLIRLKKFRAQEKAVREKSEPRPAEVHQPASTPRPPAPQPQYVMHAAVADPAPLAVVISAAKAPLAG
jgi:hypothetical protein